MRKLRKGSINLQFVPVFKRHTQMLLWVKPEWTSTEAKKGCELQTFRSDVEVIEYRFVLFKIHFKNLRQVFGKHVFCLFLTWKLQNPSIQLIGFVF